jgi:hypothetical protein
MASLAKLGGTVAVLGWLMVLGPAPGAEAASEVNGIVVYQSDFGLKDGAVSAMHGVALSVDPSLRLEDLTHEIPAFKLTGSPTPCPTGRRARCSSR